MCIRSVVVFGFILCGWGRGSAYSMLGGVRACAQAISYEVVFTARFFCVMIFVGSFDILESVGFGAGFRFALMEVLGLWVVRCLAECNRIPFDFVEGESELVRGYMVEYGGGLFVLVVISEYGSLVFFSCITRVLFVVGVGGSLVPGLQMRIFGGLVRVFFIFVRGAFPRYRYDKLIEFCWKAILPLVRGLLVLCVSLST